MAVIAALGIGGTHFQYAAGTPEGELLTETWTEPTEARRLEQQVTDAIVRLQAECNEDLFAVAVASKGLVDPKTGTIELLAINGGDTIENVELGRVVEDRFDLPLYLENDCTAAVLAEYHFGDVQADSVVHITIGTGIGAGVIDRGEIVRGESNFAGEVGGIRVGPMDGLEWCGIPGAWEAYCSGPGICHYVKDRLRTEARESRLRDVDADALDTPIIFEMADRGDRVANEYLEEISRFNAAAIATVSNLYNPGLITLGGGVALNNEARIISGITRHLDDYLVVEPPLIEATEIDMLGIYGALARVHHKTAAPPASISQQRVSR